MRAMRQAQRRPGTDQRLVDRVELVSVGIRTRQPFPLDHGAFIQRGRCVGIVLQQLRRRSAVPAQVHAAVQAGFHPSPAFRHQRPDRLRNAEHVVTVVAHRIVRGEARQPLKFAGRRLQSVDLVGGEFPAGGLVQVRLAGDLGEREAQGAGVLAPIRSGLESVAPHRSASRRRGMPGRTEAATRHRAGCRGGCGGTAAAAVIVAA